MPIRLLTRSRAFRQSCALASPLWLSALVLPLWLSGCGGGDTPPLADVRGTVTLDGQPLPQAHVEFAPTQGRPSQAMTDAQGRYRLMYTPDTPGAVLGSHTVRITTATSSPADEDNPDAKPAEEKVPAVYNRQSELQQDVVSGKNEFDFPLDSSRTAPSTSRAAPGTPG